MMLTLKPLKLSDDLCHPVKLCAVLLRVSVLVMVCSTREGNFTGTAHTHGYCTNFIQGGRNQVGGQLNTHQTIFLYRQWKLFKLFRLITP